MALPIDRFLKGLFGLTVIATSICLFMNSTMWINDVYIEPSKHNSSSIERMNLDKLVSQPLSIDNKTKSQSQPNCTLNSPAAEYLASSNSTKNASTSPYIGSLITVSPEWMESERHRCRSFFTCPTCKVKPTCLNRADNGPIKLVACTMVHPYYLQWLPEWIEYHLEQGFDKIVIYDDAGPGEEELTRQHCLHPFIEAGLVDFVNQSSLPRDNFSSCDQHPTFICRQHRAIRDCAQVWRDRKAEWLGFFDVDEFLLLDTKNRTIAQLVNALDDETSGIIFEGVGYGLDSWVQNMPPGVLLIESHTHRMPSPWLGEKDLHDQVFEETPACQEGLYVCTVSYGKTIYRLAALDPIKLIDDVHVSSPAKGNLLSGTHVAKLLETDRSPFYLAHYRLYSIEHARWHHDECRIAAALDAAPFWEAVEDNTLKDRFALKIHQSLYCRYRMWL